MRTYLASSLWRMQLLHVSQWSVDITHPVQVLSLLRFLLLLFLFVYATALFARTNIFRQSSICHMNNERRCSLTHKHTTHNITKRSFSYYIFSCTWLIYGFISSVHSNLNVVAVDGTALFFLCSPLYHRATRKALSWLDLYPSYRTRLANLNDIETCRKKKTPAVWRADE